MWRYDPIIFTNKYDVDSYGKVQKNLQRVEHREPSSDELHILLSGISDIGEEYNMKVTTCGENLNLSRYNITNGKCIDDRLINELFGTKLKLSKDNSQRMSCGCVMSVDLGVYNTCRNNCIYCYANSGVRLDCHNPNSTTLA